MSQEKDWEKVFLNTINEERKRLFNSLEPREKETFLEVFKEYTTVLCEKANKLTVDDVKDDIAFIYESIKQAPPQYIFINDSLEATTEALTNHYHGEEIVLTGYNGLLWEPIIIQAETFIRLGYMKPDPKLQQYIKFLFKGVFEYLAFDDVVFLTLCPRIFTDENGFLHRLDGPAIEWRDHRGDMFYIHGKKISKDEFDKVTGDKINV